MTELLSRNDENLATLLDKGWALNDAKTGIQKQFEFKTFVRAFGWMTQVAIVSERMNHHPEWSNIYNKVDVLLTTHSAGGLTELDIRLAKKMEAFS